MNYASSVKHPHIAFCYCVIFPFMFSCSSPLSNEPLLLPMIPLSLSEVNCSLFSCITLYELFYCFFYGKNLGQTKKRYTNIQRATSMFYLLWDWRTIAEFPSPVPTSFMRML